MPSHTPTTAVRGVAAVDPRRLVAATLGVVASLLLVTGCSDPGAATCDAAHGSDPGLGDCDAACVSGDPAASTPLERARRTGELIGNVAHEVLREIIIEGRDQQEVWTEAYGAFVPTTPTPRGGILFDDAFELGPEQAVTPDYADASDGMPVVELPYPAGRGGYFYEMTILDPVSGAIYQGDNYDGLMPAIGSWGFRGPLVPPEDARVTRSDVESIENIGSVIDDAVRETVAERCAESTFADQCVLW